MADSNKNIVIYPNRGSLNQPNIVFTGNANVAMTLRVSDDNSLSFENVTGQLFSISNNVTTGSIFSVNDISGIPFINVDASGNVSLVPLGGSNVGIGTSSPQTGLDVYGNVRITANAATTSTNTGAMVVTGNVGIGGNVNLGQSVSLTNAAQQFSIRINGAGQLEFIPNQFASAGGTPVLIIDDDAAGLTITGNLSTARSTTVGNLAITNTTVSTSTTTGALIARGGAGIVGNLFVGGSINGANINVTGSAASPNGIFLPASNTLGFSTGSTERMRIASTGNVGIGTSSPLGALHVMGNLWLSNTATVIGGIRFPDGSFLTTAAAPAFSASNLTVTSTSTNATFYPVFVENTSGNLGIRVDTGFTYNPSTETMVLQAINSPAATALSIDSGTTGAMTIGTSANAKNITIGNSTGATRLFVNTGTAGTTFHTVASGFVRVQATAAPTVDMFQIANTGFPVTTAGVSAIQINYVGGPAAIESSSYRTDLTPSGTSGSTWNGFRVVGNAAIAGVVMNAVKVDNITAGAGSNNALWLGSGWGNLINLGNSVLIRGDGSYNGRVNNINVVSTSTNATFYPAFFENTTGALAPRVDTALTYNPSTDALTAGQFIPSSSTAPSNGMFLPTTNVVGFAANGREKARITSNGNLLIGGTSDTGFRLEVTNNNLGTVANSRILGGRFTTSSSNADYLEILNVRSQAGGADWTTAGWRLQQRIDSTWMGYIQFNGSSSNIGIGTTNNNGITFGAGNTTANPNGVPEVMRISPTGRVGIGTAAPLTPLHVMGNLTISNSAGLTSGITFPDGTFQQTAPRTVQTTFTFTTANSTTTTFALSPYTSANSYIQVFVNGVYQPTNTWSWSTTNLVLNQPAPNGATVEVTVYTSINLTAGNNFVSTTSTATNATFYPVFTTATSGIQGVNADGDLTYNPSTNLLSVGAINVTSTTVPTNGMFLPAANTLGFSAAGSEDMRIDSTGNVAIGSTSTTLGRLYVTTASNLSNSPILRIDDPSTSNGQTLAIYAQSSAAGAGIAMFGNGATTPNKYLRTAAGVFQIVNSAYSATPLQLTDAGALSATGEITAYSSDARLKGNVNAITDAISKIKVIRGVTFDWLPIVNELGFEPERPRDVGVIAQEVEKVLPEIVRPAPFDRDMADPTKSKSGNNYLTVQYEKLTALLIEAVKEQQAMIERQESRMASLEALVGSIMQGSSQ